MIFKSRGAQARELQALLQTIFACESLEPSDELWLVSPWVSDIGVLDNRTGGFSGLEPAWGRRWILLTEVLQLLLREGSAVWVVTRALDSNRRFRRRLEDAARDVGATDRLTLVWDETELVHEKGLLGRGYCISGSMNFTESGVRINDEAVRYSVREDEVADFRMHFHRRYGA